MTEAIATAPTTHTLDVPGAVLDVCDIVAVVGRDQCGGRGHENAGSHIVVRRGVRDGLAQCRIAEAVAGALHLQARRSIGGGAQPDFFRGLSPAYLGRHHVRRMQARAVRGVDRAFEHLRPITRQDRLGSAHACLGTWRPCRWPKFGHRFFRAHVRPHEACPFPGRVGLVLDLLRHGARRGLGHDFEHVAVDVHLPAVIEAAQAAFFIPP